MLRFKASFEFFSSSVVYFEPNKRWFKFELALFLRQIPDMKVCESDMMMMMMMLCMYTIWLCSIGSKQTKQQQKSIGIMYDFRKTTEKTNSYEYKSDYLLKVPGFLPFILCFHPQIKKIFPSLSILFTIIAWSVCECACVCCAYFQLPQNLRIKTKIHPLGLYETIPSCPSRSWNQLSYIIYISPIYVWASFPSHMKCLRYFEFHVKQN